MANISNDERNMIGLPVEEKEEKEKKKKTYIMKLTSRRKQNQSLSK